jgi:DNA-binding SARP family transcriptional activator
VRGSGHGEPPIESAGGSYRLRVLEDELDLTVFGSLVRRAKAAREEGALSAACNLYEQAFALCQGDPCGNISQLQHHPVITDVRQELAEALLHYAEVAADVGRHDLVLRRLQTLAASEPLNERVHARLMVALAGSGRQAEALWLYEDLRARLDRDLGLYPGEELAETHLRLLRGDICSGGLWDRPASMLR